MFFVDFSVNYKPISLKFGTGNFQVLSSVKLHHLTCNKILELVFKMGLKRDVIIFILCQIV